VGSSPSNLSSTSFRATAGHHLRWEPDAVVPHVRICGGGRGQPRFLLRRAPVKTGEAVWMKEPYGEGVASRTGPESCVAARKGGGEALTGVRMGRVLSRESHGQLRGADAVEAAEGHTGCAVIARRAWTPRGQRPRARTETPHTGTGRSRFWLGLGGARVRTVNPKEVRRR